MGIEVSVLTCERGTRQETSADAFLQFVSSRFSIGISELKHDTPDAVRKGLSRIGWST